MNFSPVRRSIVVDSANATFNPPVTVVAAGIGRVFAPPGGGAGLALYTRPGILFWINKSADGQGNKAPANGGTEVYFPADGAAGWPAWFGDHFVVEVTTAAGSRIFDASYGVWKPGPVAWEDAGLPANPADGYFTMFITNPPPIGGPKKANATTPGIPDPKGTGQMSWGFPGG
jgi:hypothetical protein